ncbi:sodium:proton exchanger [Baekduia soli]|nr:sodium:proton exchanger [Baekduia soli]
MSALSTGQRLTLLVAVLATAGAGVAHYAGAASVLAFAIAAVSLATLASIVSFATEKVGARFGPAVTGVLQSTLGNLPEFFIVVFALADGQVVVAQTSVVGSLFANALLVLGVVIIVGARRDGVMRFRPRLPQDTATLMLSASFVIALVALSVATGDKASHHVDALSAVAAVCLLAIYGAWLWSYLRSDGPAAEEGGATPAGAEAAPAAHRAAVPLAVSVVLLAVAGAGAAFASDWFVSALQPAIDTLGISQAFAGLVIVAMAGNAVENVVGVVLAAKGQADLAISVVKNSVAQVAVFLFPLLVLVSLLFSHHLTFQLAPVYVGAIVLTALALWQITGDGEATVFEGVALVGMYVTLGAFAWLD